MYEAHGRPDFSDKGYPIENLEEQPQQKLCGLCGQDIKEGVHTKKIFKANFLDYNYFDPTCTHLCPACAFPFTDQAFRRTSFVCTPLQFQPLKRPDLAAWLFDPPRTEPFVFCVTTSYKKHLVFKAAANHSPRSFYVQFDDTGVMFEPEKMRPMFELLTELYGYFSKTELRTGNYYQPRVKKYGMRETMAADRRLKPYRGTPQFALLLHALNKQEEDTNE